MVVGDASEPGGGATEIYGQRIDAATGAEIGADDFRISGMGPDRDLLYGAWLPDVVYNSTDDEYLVVWSGDDDVGPLVEGEYEVFGQRLARRVRSRRFRRRSPGGGSSPFTPQGPYLPADIAADMEQATTGLYVLDVYGAMYTGGNAPLFVSWTPHFGFDVARDLELE